MAKKSKVTESAVETAVTEGEVSYERNEIERASLNYTPANQDAWEALSANEQRQVLIRKRNEQEMAAAKNVVKAFLSTKDSAVLPGNVTEAITRMLGKPSALGTGLSRGNPFMDNVRAMFQEIGDAVSELAVFKATKMGRGEFRKKVRENLKSSAPANRYWLEFDDGAESWVLLAIGGDQPDGFKGKAI